MKVNDLRPYLGDSCYVRLHCRACGGAHQVAAALERGPRDGEVLLEGHCYSVEDIEDVRPQRRPEPGLPVDSAVPAPINLMLISLLALLCAWIRIAAR